MNFLQCCKLRNPVFSLLPWASCSYHKFSELLLHNPKHPNQFPQLLSHAIVTQLFKHSFVSSKLLLYSLYDSHDLSFSSSIFSQIENPNIFSYNFMFKAYCHSSSPLETIRLYNLMLQSGVFPDNYSFPFVLKACGRLSMLDKGQEVHSVSLKLGRHFDIFVQNALISMYFSCRVISMARKVFDYFPASGRDVVSWNSMMSGYLQCECYSDVLKVFVEMLDKYNATLDEVTLVTVLAAAGRLRLLELGKIIHGLIIRKSLALGVFLGSSLIDLYAKCGKMEQAQQLFDEMPERNLVSWTCMIVGYVQLDMFKKAMNLFTEMQLTSNMLDSKLSASVISICGHIGAIDQGKWIHKNCERQGFDLHISVTNSLIDMYSKCGDVEKALQIFNRLNKRDVISWTSIISGLAMNGRSSKAIELFVQMEKMSDVRPNEVTFLAILSACSHGGFVNKGLNYFNRMTQIYNLSPQNEHYGCIVDLLGRANLLTEAAAFIKAMPLQPDAITWRSLLFACTCHGNVELAELAIGKLEELEPRKCGSRVLLSNVYSSASRWDDANKVRKNMVSGKISKLPGCSFVEVDGLVHEFFVDDRSHNQADAIYTTITGIHRATQSKLVDQIELQLQHPVLLVL